MTVERESDEREREKAMRERSEEIRFFGPSVFICDGF